MIENLLAQFNLGLMQGRNLERQDIINIIKETESRYYSAKPTNVISIHPFAELIRELEKNEKETSRTNH